MSQPISELAEHLIDYIFALENTTQRLDDKYYSKIQKMSQKMTYFYNEYNTHTRLSIEEYVSYLNHDALSPLTIVLGYAELFRSINSHILTIDEFNLVTSISIMIRDLTDSIREEHDMIITNRDQISTT